MRGHRVDRARRAQPPVHHPGTERNQQRQRGGSAPPGPEAGAAGLLGGGGLFGVVQQTQLQFVAGCFAICGRDDAARQIALQRIELITVDGGIQALRRHTGTVCRPQQRTHQPSQRQQCQQYGDCNKDAHEGSSVSLRRDCAFLRCSALSSGAAALRWLRRTKRTSATKAPIKSRNGPNHSIQVMGLTGGR